MTIEPGDLVQIDPASDEIFGGCVLTVREVKTWGVECYVRVPGSGEAYVRAEYSKIMKVGRAEWIVE